MYLAGIDLAWQCETNGSGLAFGVLESGRLRVLEASSAVIGLRAIESKINRYSELVGFAIDGPLIINNQTGQRDCERLVTRRYASRNAGCHASNLNLYPSAASVQLSRKLQRAGFMHAATSGRFQLECYPHPALIEIFGLGERLLYKKGRVQGKRDGQVKLAGLLASLNSSPVLPVTFDDELRCCMSEVYIQSLRGQGLKDNEDMLDSLVCLYIAALFATQKSGQVFGTTNDGYIYVPQVDCRVAGSERSSQATES